MAVFQDKNSRHGKMMQPTIMQQAVGYPPRFRETASAFGHEPRKINACHKLNLGFFGRKTSDCYMAFGSECPIFVEDFNPKGRCMPSPFDILRVAELIKLAADTAKACSHFNADGDTVRIREIALRIEAAAEELAQVGRDIDRRSQKRIN